MALFQLGLSLMPRYSPKAGHASIECLGLCSSIAHPFCGKIENSTMLDVYPQEYEQCAGSPGFVGAGVAPASFCRLGYDRFESHLFYLISAKIRLRTCNICDLWQIVYE